MPEHEGKLTATSDSASASEPGKPEAKSEPEWPDDVLTALPCPPEDAVDAAGTLYRYINAPEDWQTYVQQKKIKENATPHRKCRGAALSCYLSLAYVQQTLRMKGALFASAVIVEATLTAAHGKMQVTKEPHVSLWLRRSFAPSGLFKPVPS
jgi:hypothetical protein